MPLDLPVPGADANTWGTKLNNALNGTGPGTLSATYARASVPTYATSGRANRYDPARNAYNWKAANTRRLRKSLVAAQGRTGLASHAFVGDSETAYFVGSNNFPAMWPRVYRRALAAAGVPSAGTGWVPITSNGQQDPQWSFSAGWTFPQTYGHSATSAAAATFTALEPGTSVKVAYYGNSAPVTITVDGATPAGGNVAVSAGSYSTGTITPSGAQGVETATISNLSNTTHVLVVTTTGTANTYLLAAGTFATSGLAVHNLASYGATASGTGNNAWADTSYFTYVMPTRKGIVGTPDVVWLALGVNDIGGGTSVATAKAAVQTVLGQFPSSDVILIAQYQPNSASQTNWEAYVAALYDIADASNLPLIDLYDRSGGYTTANANGLMGDTVHPNANAQQDWGQLAAQLAAAPLPSQPPDVDSIGRPAFTTSQGTSAAAGANNGSSPPAPSFIAGSNDARGVVQFGSGASVSAGAQVVVTFSKPYAATPFVQVTPANGTTAATTWYATTTTTGFTIGVQTGLASSQGGTTYAFHYAVSG